ncbi:MAG TPA: radical SAM protein, partial [Urbifossiella sp.]|nr:radical SAM protein [Urbifossiella sp.]
MKVAILEPAPIDFHWFHANIRTPHLGPPILAGILRRAGHEAVVWSEMVAPIDYGRLAGADLIGLSLNTTLTHQVGYAMAARVRRLYPTTPLVAGGHHVTMNVRDGLRHVDYVVRGYAEDAFPALVEELSRGVTTPTTPGVSFRHPVTGEVVNNPAAGTTGINHLPDLDAVAGYRAHVVGVRWHPAAPATQLPLSYHSRGCGFSCHFCSIPLADNPRMSYRSAEAVVADLRYQLGFYRFPFVKPRVWLIDDNFGQQPAATKDFLRALGDARLPCRFVVQSRVEVARDPELLALMRRAGFTNVYLGIESVNPESLKSMNKRSDTDKIEAAVRAVQGAGMDVVALIMIGNDGDRPGVGARTARYLESLGVRHMTPQIAVPYPGTEYHRRLAAEGRIFSTDYRRCNVRPVHFPSAMRPSQVVREICALTDRFLSRGRVLAGLLRGDLMTWTSRRGAIRSGFLRRALAEIPHLQRFEAPYYDRRHVLDAALARAHAAAGEFAAAA